MDRKEFENHRVDKVPLKRSKQLMWQHIQKKARVKQSWAQRLAHFLGLHKFSFTAALAGIVIAVVVTVNLSLPVFNPTLVQASFELQALDEDAAGVASDSGFKLIASEAVSEQYVKENLMISPAVDFQVEQKDDKTFEIIPEVELESDQIYQFSIVGEAEGEAEEFTWSYQVKDDFKILNVFPGDKTSYVPADTGIDIHFSHEGFKVTEVMPYFEISPAVEGEFEKHQRVLSFVPTEPLSAGGIYTVALKKDLPLSGTDQVLSDDYQFEFQIQEGPSDYADEGTHFLRQFYEVAEDQLIGLFAHQRGEDSKADLLVKMYRFEDEAAYREVLGEQLDGPSWATRDRVLTVDSSVLDYQGEAEALFDERGWMGYIYLPTTELEKGFYLFEIENEGENSQALVQISNLSAYINLNEAESLVWVNDLKTGQPVKGADIEFETEAITLQSDNDGIATFVTPETLKGQQGRRTLLTLRKEDDVLVKTVDLWENYQTFNDDYWHHFSTDRPVYKPGDDVKFWGFIEPRGDQPLPSELRLTLTRGVNTPVREQSLQLSNDGFFTGFIQLSGLSGDQQMLSLYDGEILLFSRYLNTQNYVKPAYDLSVVAEKKVVFAGDDVDIQISAQFFDGTPVANLPLTFNREEEQKQITTSSTGEYETSINLPLISKAPCYEYCTNEEWERVSVRPTAGEEGDIVDVAGIKVLGSRLLLDAESQSNGQTAMVTLHSHHADLEKEDQDYRGEPAPELAVEVKIIEWEWQKKEDGEYYDFINKKVVKNYLYTQSKQDFDTLSVITGEVGEGSFDFEMDPEKHYTLYFNAQDENAQYAHHEMNIYGDNYNDPHGSYNILIPDSPDSSDLYYRKQFDTGESITATFAEGDGVLPEDVEGKFLFMQHQNGLQEYAVEAEPSYTFEFEERDVPNLYVGGVWFDGSNYRPAFAGRVSYRKELKRLNIELIPEEDNYAPGDKVVLNAIVTDQDGDPVEANLNLNLVDEAYYKAVYDYFSDPLEDLYMPVNDGVIYGKNTHETPFTTLIEGDRGGCFVAGTRILMADGSYKPIEDVQQGDQILTKASPNGSRLVPGNVVSTVHHEVSEFLVINNNLRVTPEHIIFANGRFMPAGELKTGDHLFNKSNGLVEINSIRPHRELVDVYNFEVEKYHTYFANDFYVHNDKGEFITRKDFEDNAYFSSVMTNESGEATVTFMLPDNITSWRVTAKAINSDSLQAGMGVGSIPVSLPLFTDLIYNQEYSINDKPQVKLRAFGSSLNEGDALEFGLSSESLDFEVDSLQAEAFESIYVDLPELILGENDLRAAVERDGKGDALQKDFRVVDSRLNQTELDFIPNLKTIDQLLLNSDHPIEITLLDGGRGLYYRDLIELYHTPGDRIDQRLSQWVAKEMLARYFNQVLPEPKAFVLSNYQTDGLRLLPYAEADLELTVLTLLMDIDAERFETRSLSEYLYNIYTNKESNLSEIVQALSGLAAMDEPVLNSLKLLKNEPQLSSDDKLYIALGLASLGDMTTAQSIYDELATDLNQSKSTTRALGAVLAAALSESVAAEQWRMAKQGELEDEFLNLYQIGYLKHALKKANSSAVSLEWVQNGTPKSIELKNGSVQSLDILPGDSIGLYLKSGQLAAIVRSTTTVDPEDFEQSESLSIERRYFVGGQEVSTFEEGQLVRVELTVTQSAADVRSPTRITDILPSGLAPIVDSYSATAGWEEDLSFPYQVDGQEVNFIWDQKFNIKRFSYMARIVAPGEYYADPAKIESFKDPSIRSISDPAWVVVEAL